MTIKNFWSLTVDEAIVADKLRQELKSKNYEVFFPLNAQLKEVDLALINLRTKKLYTIQVKGSRSYQPQKREVKRFGEGRGGWVQIKRSTIFKPQNRLDYFIFLIHLETQGENKREITLNYLVIPRSKFKKSLTHPKKKVGKNGVYDFFVWINPKTGQATEFYQWKNPINFTEYLNNFALIK